MVEVVFVAVVMPFEDFATTFVYIVVWRFVFDCGGSFVFGISFD